MSLDYKILIFKFSLPPADVVTMDIFNPHNRPIKPMFPCHIQQELLTELCPDRPYSETLKAAEKLYKDMMALGSTEVYPRLSKKSLIP